MATFWEHLQNITLDKKPYLGDDGWNIYMINRYLSMDKDYCEVVNELQRSFRGNGKVSNEMMYNTYRDLLPKQKKYFKYVKAEISKKYSTEELDAVATHYEISKREAKYYIDILGKAEVKNIISQQTGK